MIALLEPRQRRLALGRRLEDAVPKNREGEHSSALILEELRELEMALDHRPDLGVREVVRLAVV